MSFSNNNGNENKLIPIELISGLKLVKKSGKTIAPIEAFDVAEIKLLLLAIVILFGFYEVIYFRSMITKNESMIFLGDSYTIGEGVATVENFPNQLIKKLNNHYHVSIASTIVAKTGWTTNELLTQIEKTIFQTPYVLGTLLIGVNNQYRGLDIATYEKEFVILLKKAIALTTDANAVIVISIPDWGRTPFAKDRDQKKIGSAIDQFNAVNKRKTLELGSHYIDITTGNRLRSNASNFIASDGLHPSAEEYKFWSDAVFELINDKKLLGSGK